MTKQVVLCADDYGQSLAISQAILELISAQRLSAVSCLVNMPNSETHATWLSLHHTKVDIGLHFNLSENSPISTAYRDAYGKDFLPLTKLMRLAYSRKLALPILMAECHAQIDRFQAMYGFAPDFLDGHQHVHQFPVIREALLQVFKERLPHAYIRFVKPVWCLHNLNVLLKQAVLYALGTSAFHAHLMQENIPHNRSFAGMYHFAGDYRRWFIYFLRTITNQGLIMCHPSLDGIAKRDGIARARYQEYLYMQSDAFLKDCQAYDVDIARFNTIITPSII